MDAAGMCVLGVQSLQGLTERGIQGHSLPAMP